MGLFSIIIKYQHPLTFLTFNSAQIRHALNPKGGKAPPGYEMINLTKVRGRHEKKKSPCLLKAGCSIQVS